MLLKRMPARLVLLALASLGAGGAAAGQSPGGGLRALPPETRAERDRRMAWWREAKFGMFIHWGAYAVPAGTYKGRRVGGIGEWIMDRAKIPVPEYEKFVARFDPVKFDADEWARIAADAGMKYMVITSKHHDGFCLWDSKVSDYDIMDAAPFKRDILKELAGACGRQGVRFCFYHSIMDWHHPDAKRAGFSRYREDYLLPQIRELLTGYGPIGVMWFDGEWIGEWTEPMGKDLYALCRELQPAVIVNNRVGKGRKGMQGMSKSKEYAGDFGTPEQEIPHTGLPGVDWETCMTMNGTWGFKSYDHNWKSTRDLLRKLVDIASKGGNFLLNVGPTAEGLIPAPSVERLAAMGRWMEANGESIYGTTASPFKRLPWGRCTAKPGRLFLQVFDWPKGKLEVPGLKNETTRAYVLADGARRALRVERDGARIRITLPPVAPDRDVSVVVLEIVGDPEVDTTIRQAEDGTVTLPAADAEIKGRNAKYETDKSCVGYWTDPKASVTWEFVLTAPGEFEVELTHACQPGSEGSLFRIEVGDEAEEGGAELEGRVTATGSWSSFATKTAGSVTLEAAGVYTLTVGARKIARDGLMNLRSVVLRPKGE